MAGTLPSSDNNQLESISLNTVNYDPVRFPILFDFLPDKIDCYDGDPKTLKYFGKRKNVMTSVKLTFYKRISHCHHIDYSRIFKLKAEKCILRANYKDYDLSDLSQCGSLPPNETIKELWIPVDFTPSKLFQYFYDPRMFVDDYLPKCRKAFKILKSVNPNLELSLCHDSRRENVELEFGTIVKDINQLLKNIDLLIDSAREIGIKISKIVIDRQYKIFDFVPNVDHSDEIDEIFSNYEDYEMTFPSDDGFTIFCTKKYSGAEIRFTICFYS